MDEPPFTKSKMVSRPHKDHFEKKRLETFVDAILAIILTILVLDFKVPRIEHATAADLKTALKELGPAAFSYVISFWTVIALWIDHHNLFEHLTKSDKNFAVLNMLFLLCLSPLPFTTAFAGEYIHIPIAVAAVGTNYVLMNGGFSLLYGYVIKKKFVPETYLRHQSYRLQTTVSIGGFILLMASIPLAYVNTYASFGIFIIVIIAHLVKK